ncbi:MAG: ribosomal protein S18-alanine N-acetyltransferase [Fimbriimonadia bacterium]|jgi:ribosomal-protein-alanine N-acetyltransferase
MSAVLQRLRIEPMREEHLDAIMEIEVRAYACPWSRASFAAELTNHMSHYVVLKQAGMVIGYAGEWLIVDEAHITTVAVAPEQRRKRYGELLVCELLRHAVEKGMARATLEVRSSNVVARRLYEKYGFVTVAIRKAYYPDKEDACVMWLNDLQSPEYVETLNRLRKECARSAGLGD